MFHYHITELHDFIGIDYYNEEVGLEFLQDKEDFCGIQLGKNTRIALFDIEDKDKCFYIIRDDKGWMYLSNSEIEFEEVEKGVYEINIQWDCNLMVFTEFSYVVKSYGGVNVGDIHKMLEPFKGGTVVASNSDFLIIKCGEYYYKVVEDGSFSYLVNAILYDEFLVYNNVDDNFECSAIKLTHYNHNMINRCFLNTDKYFISFNENSESFYIVDKCGNKRYIVYSDSLMGNYEFFRKAYFGKGIVLNHQINELACKLIKYYHGK